MVNDSISYIENQPVFTPRVVCTLLSKETFKIFINKTIILPLKLKCGTFVLKPEVGDFWWFFFSFLTTSHSFFFFYMSNIFQIRKPKDNIFVTIQKYKLSCFSNSPQMAVTMGMLSTHLSGIHMSASQKCYSFVSIVWTGPQEGSCQGKEIPFFASFFHVELHMTLKLLFPA